MYKEKLFNRDFTLLALGQAFSLVGNYALKIALSMYVLELTGSAAVFAGMLALAMVPTILLSPFGGMLADRCDRRKLMAAIDAVSGAAVLLSVPAVRYLGGTLPAGALLVVLSVLGAFESPTVQACVPQLLSGDNILRGNSVVNQIQALAGLVTPFLGSLMYAALGLETVLLAAGLCFWVTAVLECFIRLGPPPERESSGLAAAVREDFRDSLRFLRRDEPAVLRLLLLCGLRKLLRGRHGGSGLPAPCAQCAGAFGRALRSGGERHGRGGCAGRPGGGPRGDETEKARAAHSLLWVVAAACRACILASY